MRKIKELRRSIGLSPTGGEGPLWHSVDQNRMKDRDCDQEQTDMASLYTSRDMTYVPGFRPIFKAAAGQLQI